MDNVAGTCAVALHILPTTWALKLQNTHGDLLVLLFNLRLLAAGDDHQPVEPPVGPRFYEKRRIDEELKAATRTEVVIEKKPEEPKQPLLTPEEEKKTAIGIVYVNGAMPVVGCELPFGRRVRGVFSLRSLIASA